MLKMQQVHVVVYNYQKINDFFIYLIYERIVVQKKEGAKIQKIYQGLSLIRFLDFWEIHFNSE